VNEIKEEITIITENYTVQFFKNKIIFREKLALRNNCTNDFTLTPNGDSDASCD
jgi:hypothetical protein